MAHMFSNSKDTSISGSNTFKLITIQNHLSADKIDEGLKILYAHAAPGALHNSGERFDPPNCHPGTRVTVLEEIKSWIDDSDSEHPVMWMNGPMGGGKSSIAQALAEFFQKRGQLSGSFFFARANPTRNNKDRLIATLAYQMTKEMPEIRQYISAPILHDPLIFESSLEEQIAALIIGPHLHSADSDSDESACRKPRLLIIDGLDECIDKEAQDRIVKACVSLIATHQNTLPISLKILIVSQPEVNINAAFRYQKHSTLVKVISLDKRWLPDQDIKNFLMDSFENIRGSHPIGQLLLAHWPPIEDVDELVKQSSGQFIYASVVIKFLQSPQNHPIESLKVILGLSKDANSRPYAELDALYAHIFSKVRNLPVVLHILCLCLLNSRHNLSTFVSQEELISDILELPKGMLTVSLTNLVSVLDYNPNTDRQLRFYHASLPEFLQDQDRSGELYVNRDNIRTDLVCCCISRAIKKDLCLDMSANSGLHIFMLLYEDLGAEARSSLCDALSNIDILPMLEVRQYSPFTIHSKYFSWLFAEHAKNLKTELPNSLENAVKSCLAYILQQFKVFPFSGFDQTDGVNIWIFAMFREIDYYGKESAKALSILMNFDCSEIPKIQTPASVQLCLQILHSIPLDILRNSKVFGEYAITDDQCINAALCIFKAIPKMKPSWDDPLCKFLVYDQWRIVSKLLHQMPASENLYKIFKVAMVQCTSKTFSEGDSLQKLAYQYVLATLGSYDSSSRDYSNMLASIFADYMEKTQPAIPNIDSIIEEEQKAEPQLPNKSSRISMRRVMTSLKEYFRKKRI